MNTQQGASISKIDFPAGGNMREPQRRLNTAPQARGSDVGRFFTGFLIVVFCAGAAWPLLPRRYELTASVILRSSDFQGDNVQSLRQPLDDNAIQSEMDIIASPAIAAGVIGHHDLAKDPEFASNPDSLHRRFLKSLYTVLPIASEWFGDLRGVSEGELREQLQKHLTVSRDRRSYTVKMGYWSSNPAKAAALTDTLLNTYLSNQLTRRRGNTQQHSAWLIERVDELQARYENSERAIRELGQSSGLTDGTVVKSLEAQRSSLTQEAADIKGRMNAITSQGLALAQRSKAPMGTALVPGSISLAQAANPDIRPLELRLAVVDNALRAVGEEITERQLADAQIGIVAAGSSDRQGVARRSHGAVERTRVPYVLRRTRCGDSARPDAALRPNFPNAFLFVIGTLVAAIAAGLGMAWNPRRREARGDARVR